MTNFFVAVAVGVIVGLSALAMGCAPVLCPFLAGATAIAIGRG